MLYKSAIKKAKDAMKNSISNKLQYTPVNKKPTEFWKTWKNKVWIQSLAKIVLVLNLSDKEAANTFADLFKSACSPNDEKYCAQQKLDYKERIANYLGDKLPSEIFNAELIALCVAN